MDNAEFEAELAKYRVVRSSTAVIVRVCVMHVCCFVRNPGCTQEREAAVEFTPSRARMPAGAGRRVDSSAAFWNKLDIFLLERFTATESAAIRAHFEQVRSPFSLHCIRNLFTSTHPQIHFKMVRTANLEDLEDLAKGVVELLTAAGSEN